MRTVFKSSSINVVPLIHRGMVVWMELFHAQVIRDYHRMEGLSCPHSGNVINKNVTLGSFTSQQHCDASEIGHVIRQILLTFVSVWN